MSFVDHDAERAVIAAVILQPGASGHAAYARLTAILGGDAFDDPRHATVWEAIGRVVAAGRGLDVVTICAELAAMRRINAVGGAQYIGALADVIPTIAHVDAHAGIVADLAVRRRALAAADAHRARILAGEDIAASVARMERSSREGMTGARDISASAAVDAAWNELCDTATMGARYGVGPLDDLLGGLFAGQLTGLGGVPGGGKTALAVTAADATASAGGRVLFGALEMPREDLAWRLAAGYCEGDPPSVDRIRSRRLGDHELADLQRATRVVSALPLLIEDRAITCDAFCAIARAEHSRASLSLIVVDYLHLFQPDAVDVKAREDQVIRRHVYALKALAKALRVPVIMLVQFNRVGAKSDRPTMFDAFGGSAIEQGCDNVMILAPEKDAPTGPTVRVAAYVDKRRGGAPCKEGVGVVFDRGRQRFTDGSAFAAPAPDRYGADDWGTPEWNAAGGDAE